MVIKARSYLNSRDIVFIFVLVSFAFMVAYFWPRTWDDSAITLAFSRNLVKYGDIIPSQFSDRVEGYSTFLWMLINALFFWLGLREDQVLNLAKILSTSFVIVNIFLFWQLLKEKIENTGYQVIALFLFVLNARTIAAALDGMETPLYASLVLLSYFLYWRKDKSVRNYAIFSLVSSLLVLIRFEGVLFLIPFGLETICEKPKSFLKEPYLYFWTVVFITYQIWHYSYFGELLTNPMLAKGYWPYRPEFTSIAGFINYYSFPFREFALNYFFIFILLAVYFAQNKRLNQLGLRHREWRLIFWMAIVGVFIMSITGGNWDAANRLAFPALPFIFLVLFHLVDGAPFRSLVLRSKVGTILVLAGLLINALILFQFINNLHATLTVETIRETSRVVTFAQNYLQRKRITFAGADMGGLLLYDGDGKRVIDLGLLCNQEFAKHGYQNFEPYLFQTERPEIIETHARWLKPFLSSDMFTQMYSPVKVLTDEKDVFLFLRRDVLSDVIGRDEVTEAAMEDSLVADSQLQTILLKFDRYWILDLRGS